MIKSALSNHEIAFATTAESSSETRLHGYGLWIARLIWCGAAALLVSLFFAALPYYYANHSQPCPTPETCVPLQLQTEDLPFLYERGLTLESYAFIHTSTVSFSAATYFVMAVLLFWRKSDDGLAIFTSLFMLSFGTTWSTVLTSLERVFPEWRLIGYGFSIFSFVSAFIVFYIFPTGQFVPRWTRFLVPLVIVAAIIQPSSLFNSIELWMLGMFVLLLISAIYAQIYRYRAISSLIQRQQTKWVMWAGIIMLMGSVIAVGLLLVVPDETPGTIRIVFYTVAAPLLLELPRALWPIALVAAILRYRLWDIDLIISRTLVYSVLTAATFSLYIMIVGLLGLFWHRQDSFFISLVGTGFVAILFQPLREHIQRLVNQVVYGERDDPYTVLSRLGQRLEDTISPHAILTMIVTTVQEALNLSYTAITFLSDDATTIAAAAGIESSQTVSVPLMYQRETIGHLILGTRAPGESFSAADWRLVNDLARQAGIAVNAVRLTHDLQHAREQLVTTREEERRRLRNDMHDQLGLLAALTLKIGSAPILFKRDPAALEALLETVETDMGAAVSDLRNLAYQLRPPVIDQLGLVEALRALVIQVQQNTQRYSVTAPDELPLLPAAFEVAIYRITQEALANIARHAHAQVCQVSLRIQDQVTLEIRDDGVGMAIDHRVGVGLSSMRERAEELGGTYHIETAPQKGTCIRVCLPSPMTLSHDMSENKFPI